MVPKQKEEEKGYRVCSHTFKGGNDDLGYTYEITFNKSLVHTGRFTGIWTTPGPWSPRARPPLTRTPPLVGT